MTCLSISNNNMSLDSASINFGFPYDRFSFTFNPPHPNASQPICQVSLNRPPFSSSVQFFAAVGVLSMFYVIAALIMYILFITPACVKWLVIAVS